MPAVRGGGRSATTNPSRRRAARIPAPGRRLATQAGALPPIRRLARGRTAIAHQPKELAMLHRRRLIAAAAAVAAVGVPAAAVSVPSAGAAGSKTIVDVAAGDKQFSTLVKLVKSAGLAKTLSSGKYTVFAPTNKAFAKVPKATLDALAKDKAQLKAVLLYHVVKGRVPASKVVKLKSAKTLNGARVKIKVRKGSVYLNGSTKVTKADVKASNGIIHVINRVLLPPSR
jgi:uncharacterized surface protein with fasciclin (FAS1) repeats